MTEVVVGPSRRGNVVCDLDGVVYLEDREVPGAGEALARLEEMGYRLLFVTNNSTTPARRVAARITGATRYRARPEQVITSAQAAARLLEAERPPALVVGGDGVVEALGERGVPVTRSWEEAGAVVVGLDPELTYGKLRAATLALRRAASRR